MTLNPTSSKGSGGGGSGTVTAVSSTNTAIAVANPTTTPALTLATLDVIAADGPPAADWSNNTHKITSLLDPTLAQDAATKAYVDAAITGVTWKAACAWATAAALPANVYANGASGVGATLTASANGALTIDGNTPTVLDRVLVKNQVADANNGIYVVTTVGTAGTKYVLTRATDFDQAAEITAGDTVPVVGGTANADTSWMMTTTGAIVVGTTALVFAQFSGVVSVTATDTSIVVGGTKSAPTIATGTLDVIATQHPPAADWSNNSHKITNVSNGTNPQDAAAFGQIAAAGGGVSIFGDGSDGSVVFDGSTTILGMAPSSNVYTLTRDFFFSAVTLNSGVQIKTNGFRIFCSGTFTGGSSTSIIQWNGAAGVVTAAGGATSNGSSSFSGGTTTASPGTAGGAGGTAAGSAGVNQATTGGLGGAGGAGGTGNGGANAGGAGGTINANAAANGSLRAAPSAITLVTLGGTTVSRFAGGAGGGGGGGDGTAGGGGGAGGGIVAVYAKTFAGTGAIQARGGAGGTPAGGNRGGGAGGGGGLVVVISQSVVAGAVSGWTIDAAIGAAGTSTGNGGTPGAATAGLVVLLPA